MFDKLTQLSESRWDCCPHLFRKEHVLKLRIGRAVATIALTAGTIMATAGIASAHHGWDHVWYGVGVSVYVHEYGDQIVLCDTAKNGHSAWIEVYDSELPQYTMVVSTGAGTCKQKDASDPYGNLAENVRVGLRFGGNDDDWRREYFSSWASVTLGRTYRSGVTFAQRGAE